MDSSRKPGSAGGKTEPERAPSIRDVISGIPGGVNQAPALPRGRPGDEADQYETPKARFADPAEIVRDLTYNEERHLFLGVLGGSVRLDENKRRYIVGGQAIGIEDDRHMMTIAGTRAGKGRAAIVPNLMKWRGSVLAIDPKGELAKLTAEHRATELKQKVYVLDPFGEARMGTAKFNPLAGIAEGTAVETAALIADALVVVGGREPHWDESARAFIEGLILHAATYFSYANSRDLGMVRELLGRAGSDELQLEMKTNFGADGLVRMAANNFFDRPLTERGSVLSTARRHLKFLDYPQIRNVLAGDSSFSLSDLKTGDVTVYLCLPARHMGSCSRWLRLFINLALQAMEATKLEDRTKDGKDFLSESKTASGLPVLFCMDEFATLGHMKQIEDAAGQIAGFGVKLWPILQDLGQLKALYKERWETFMGNAGVLQFFGNNDLSTLEWISKRCGKTTVRVEKESPSGALEAKKQVPYGLSWSGELHDLLTPEEAGLFFGRSDPLLRQLIIRPGERPMALQLAYYDKHERFPKPVS